MTRAGEISKNNTAWGILRTAALTWAMAIVLLLGGCDRPPDNGGGDVKIVDLDDTKPTPKMRVVSYAPAVTKMIIDLGKADLLVGRAEKDGAAPQDLPLVGNAFSPNIEKLSKLNPDVVITMSGASGPNDTLKLMAENKAFRLVNYKYPKDVTGVLNILLDEQARLSFVPREGMVDKPTGDSLAVVLDATKDGFELGNQMLDELLGLSQTTPRGLRPRVLLVIGTEPAVRASGPGTVMHELLTRYAGGENAAIPSRVIPRISTGKKIPQLKPLPSIDQIGTAPTFDREGLLLASPEVILILSPGAPALKPIDEDPRLRDFRGLDIPAVTKGRIVLIDDPMILLPESTAMGRVAKLMRNAIYPDAQVPVEKLPTSEGEKKASAQNKPSPAPRPAPRPDATPDASPAPKPDAAPVSNADSSKGDAVANGKPAAP